MGSYSIRSGKFCECGKPNLASIHAVRGDKGFKRRPKHDLCDGCWHKLLDQAIAKQREWYKS